MIGLKAERSARMTEKKIVIRYQKRRPAQPKKSRTLEDLMNEMKAKGAAPIPDGKSAAAGRND